MTSQEMLQILVSLLVGVAIAVGFYKLLEKKRKARLEKEAEQLLDAARRQAETERCLLYTSPSPRDS